MFANEGNVLRQSYARLAPCESLSHPEIGHNFYTTQPHARVPNTRCYTVTRRAVDASFNN